MTPNPVEQAKLVNHFTTTIRERVSSLPLEGRNTPTLPTTTMNSWEIPDPHTHRPPSPLADFGQPQHWTTTLHANPLAALKSVVIATNDTHQDMHQQSTLLGKNKLHLAHGRHTNGRTPELKRILENWRITHEIHKGHQNDTQDRGRVLTSTTG